MELTAAATVLLTAADVWTEQNRAATVIDHKNSTRRGLYASSNREGLPACLASLFEFTRPTKSG